MKAAILLLLVRIISPEKIMPEKKSRYTESKRQQIWHKEYWGLADSDLLMFFGHRN